MNKTKDKTISLDDLPEIDRESLEPKINLDILILKKKHHAIFEQPVFSELHLSIEKTTPEYIQKVIHFFGKDGWD